MFAEPRRTWSYSVWNCRHFGLAERDPIATAMNLGVKKTLKSVTSWPFSGKYSPIASSWKRDKLRNIEKKKKMENGYWMRIFFTSTIFVSLQLNKKGRDNHNRFPCRVEPMSTPCVNYDALMQSVIAWIIYFSSSNDK